MPWGSPKLWQPSGGALPPGRAWQQDEEQVQVWGSHRREEGSVVSLGGQEKWTFRRENKGRKNVAVPDPGVQAWSRQAINAAILVCFHAADKDIPETGYLIKKKRFNGLTIPRGRGGLSIMAEKKKRGNGNVQSKEFKVVFLPAEVYFNWAFKNK